MNNQDIPANQSYLSVELPDSLNTSPSVSTFRMSEEDASMCPLLPNTPSPPLDFNHPLTPNEVTTDASKLILEKKNCRKNFITFFHE